MIYLASAYANYAIVRAWAVALRARDAVVCSTWHDLPADPQPSAGDQAIADQCLAEVAAADLLVFFDGAVAARGGLVELGAALGDPRTRVIWATMYGDASANVFDRASRIERASTDAALVYAIGCALHSIFERRLPHEYTLPKVPTRAGTF
jgi:hypothetical protein